jgi:organic radical activating enzyme
MRELRRNMLEGRQSLSCERCYETENRGVESERQIVNNRLAHHLETVGLTRDDGSLPDFSIPFLVVRFSNLCNFRCRMCDPSLSTAWYQDIYHLEPAKAHMKVLRPMDDPKDLCRQIEPLLPYLEQIYFVGGEPLIQAEHYWVLEYLLKHGLNHVRLNYSTNFSTTRFQGQDVMELWAQFEQVQVGASLDASGRRGEYLRKGQRWERLIDDRERMKRICPRACFFVATTVTIFNALHVPDLHRELVENGIIRCQELSLNILRDPQEYCIQLLPSSLKNAVAEKYERHIEEFIKPYGEAHGPSVWAEEPLYRNVVSFMRERDLSGRLDGFIERTRELDRIRGEDVLAVFPELAPLFRERAETGRDL